MKKKQSKWLKSSMGLTCECTQLSHMKSVVWLLFFKKTWKKCLSHTIGSLGDASAGVLKTNGYETKYFSARKLNSLMRDFIHFGGFRPNLRGKWKRDAIWDVFPGIKTQIQHFVKITEPVNCELTSKFVNSIILERANADETLKKELNLRGINWEKGISVSTCHLWMLAAGCKYCEKVKHYFTNNHNRADVIEYCEKYNEE